MDSKASTLLLLISGIVILMTGCATERRSSHMQSAVDLYPTADDELDFLDALAASPAVTNNDALHALLMLADDEAGALGSYQERVAAAQARGWIGAGANPPANESATVGVVAVAACDVMDHGGGVVMSVLGPSPRYCTRELVYLGLMPMRTEFQSMSGSDLIDLLGRVEDRMTGLAMTPASAAEPTEGE